MIASTSSNMTVNLDFKTGKVIYSKKDFMPHRNTKARSKELHFNIISLSLLIFRGRHVSLLHLSIQTSRGNNSRIKIVIGQLLVIGFSNKLNLSLFHLKIPTLHNTSENKIGLKELMKNNSRI